MRSGGSKAKTYRANRAFDVPQSIFCLRSRMRALTGRGGGQSDCLYQGEEKEGAGDELGEHFRAWIE
ncbi:hypothetical protein B0H19DRAFT_687200 [Mycena capillaripes]|nr:hypothetical protein B0H19DRAFT_687200 [Mycena capillaripes]